MKQNWLIATFIIRDNWNVMSDRVQAVIGSSEIAKSVYRVKCKKNERNFNM